MSTKKDVGYRKPPAAHQWQPGQSGNPSGKKKGCSKKEAKSFQDTLAILLQEPVLMTIKGKKQKVMLGEVLARKLLHNLVNADLKPQVDALKSLIGMGAIDVENTRPGEEEFQDPFSETDRRYIAILAEELGIRPNTDGP